MFNPIPKETQMSKVYEIITSRIIEQLEKGTVPWHKPWNGDLSYPRNGVSQRAYRGINVFLLGCSEYSSPNWLTFKQAKDLGGAVRKGEKSTPVIFWKWLDKEDSETGDAIKVPLLRYYNVFNVSQCDLPADKLPPEPKIETFPFSPIETCEQVVSEMANPPAIESNANAAFYRPSSDSVHMPSPERFEKAEEFYSTLFHELTHATGHKSRLHREGIADVAAFGSRTYSKEELIAEMGSAFLCGHCRIEQTTLDNSAAYINGWLKKLKGDSKLVIHAAAAAQKATDLILGTTFQED